MNKKTLKVILIIATIIVGLSSYSCVFALDPSNISTDPNDPNGKIVSTGSTIAGYITTVAMVVAVIVLMVLGIKYLVGSAEQKAEYKKSFIPYIVGAVLVFGASGIATMVFTAASKIANQDKPGTTQTTDT